MLDGRSTEAETEPLEQSTLSGNPARKEGVVVSEQVWAVVTVAEMTAVPLRTRPCRG